MSRFNAFLSRGIAKNTLLLVAGSVVARVIGIAAMPIIARIYSAEDFGILAIYMSIVTMVASVATLKYAVVIPLPRSNRMAGNIVALCMLILGVVGVLESVVLLVAGEQILSIVSAENLASYWWLLVLGTVGVAGYEVLGYWATRKKEFRLQASSQALRSFYGAVIKILFGVVGGTQGLLWGQASQYVLGAFPLVKYALRTVCRPKIVLMRMAMLKYADAVFYRVPSQILSSLSIQAPIFLSASMFGVSTTGQLSIAISAVALPMSLLGGNIGRAYLGEIAALGQRRAREIYHITLGVVKSLSALALLPGVVIFIWGPDVISIAFGARWYQAGEFVRVLSFSLVAQFVSSPVIHAMSVMDRQGMYLRMNVIRIFVVLAAFGVSFIRDWDALSAIALYSAALTLHYLLTLVQVLWMIRKEGGKLR